MSNATDPALRRVHTQAIGRAVERMTAAQDRLESAMREARAAGLSLRVIAEASGLSHEQVRRVTAA